MLTVGIPKEIKTAEHRVALTPDGVRELIARGVPVFVETRRGRRVGHPRRGLRASGGRPSSPPRRTRGPSRWSSRSRSRSPSEFGYLRADLALFTYLHLAAYPDVAKALLAAGTTGIAYETVQTADGALPLLAPMSEVAGRMATQIGAHYLERHNGGRGVLMGGAPGVQPARVVVIGAGNVGWNAAWIAAGMEAEVNLLDKNIDRLRFVDQIHKGRISTLASNRRHGRARRGRRRPRHRRGARRRRPGAGGRHRRDGGGR